MESLYPIRLFKDHTYAIVEPEALSDWSMDLPLIPLVPQGLEKEKAQLPALLSMAALQPSLRLQLLEILAQAQQRKEHLPVVTFLDSEVQTERMRAHWARQMIVSLPNQKKALLRSYDPRVLAQLQWMCTASQLKTLFGPVKRWTIYLDARWQSMAAPTAAPLSSLFLNKEQAALLGRIEPINEVLYKLPEEKRIHTEPTSRVIDALLLRAQAHGLTRREDIVQFALDGMRIHPAFDSHPEIARLIAERDPQEQTYCDVMALLEDSTWERIATDLSAHEKASPTGANA